MNRFGSMLFLLSTLCGLTACGPKVQISPEFVPFRPPYIALLPVDAPSSIQRERAAYLVELLRIGLEDKGYVLLDADVVERYCADVSCQPGRAALVKQFGVTKFVSLKLESISNVNFVAGYYSALSGELQLQEADASVLYEAIHTERDSGGVILESGQLIQAVINQARSGEEGAIDDLSSGFVDELLDKLPSGLEIAQNEAGRAVAIETAEVSTYRGAVKRVCVKGTQGSLAWLHSKSAKSRAELKEVSRGLYCGVFRLVGPWSLDSGLRVELRSAFGDVARQKISKEQINFASISNSL